MIDIKKSGVCENCGYIELETEQFYADSFGGIGEPIDVLIYCKNQAVCQRAYEKGKADEIQHNHSGA